MPLCRFQCQSCGAVFEIFLRLSDLQEGVCCSNCGSLKVEETLKHSTTQSAEACSLDKKT